MILTVKRICIADCSAGLQGEGQAEEEADDCHLQRRGVRARVGGKRADNIHPECILTKNIYFMLWNNLKIICPLAEMCGFSVPRFPC